ncbi:MAG: biotin--[acetyl-CoA-carboxylase] ligase [Muribaculaceae bacterium]
MIQWLDSCESTNTYIASQASLMADGDVVAARTQSAGRGQRGNSWEAEPGANLTFSMLLRPAELAPARQFELSMAVSLAIVDVLDGLLPHPLSAQIKWPNDIYVTDKKICGILIEHSLTGSKIQHTIVGIGLNVNQQQFFSDAPNPVSLIHLTGHTTPPEPLLQQLAQAIIAATRSYDTASLRRRYFAKLYRGTGLHPYIDTGSGERFLAEIADVAADGIITLRKADGNERRYAFKEVAFG